MGARMRDVFPPFRRAAIFLVGIGSVVGAGFLVWLLATREQMGSLSNAHLAGMLALFLLPGATMAAWELDRRASLRRVDPEPARDDEPSLHTHRATTPVRILGRGRPLRHRGRVLHRARAVR